MSNSTINVLTISADNVIHASWRNALLDQAGLTLTNEARNVPEFLSALQHAMPDVFLLDSRFQFGPGALLLARLHLICPQTKTIVFCDVVGQREVVDATAHGVRGLLQKNSAPAQWLKAIRVVHEGGIWIDRRLMADALQVLLQLPSQHAPLDEPESAILTKREWEVVHWVGLGMTNKEIARKMAISDNTVKTHLQHIFSKLKVGRRLRLPAGLASLAHLPAAA